MKYWKPEEQERFEVESEAIQVRYYPTITPQQLDNAEVNHGDQMTDHERANDGHMMTVDEALEWWGACLEGEIC